MPHTLKNQQLEILIDLPHENYVGSRFDWSGKIREVKFGGKSVVGLEVLDSHLRDHSGRGFYNEFGIESPLAYAETAIGDWFHKIGVGLLQKDEDQYSFGKPYPIKPCEFDVKGSLEKLQIDCQSPAVNGFAYRLKKEFSLLVNGFAIRYQLSNTGEKTILTDEYNHNFIALNQDLIGKNYQLRFPFSLMPSHFVEYVNPEQILSLAQSEVRFKDTPQEAFFISNLSGGKTVIANWELINQRNKLGIREMGDFQTKKINLWGCGHVISPELFVEISLPPHQSTHWARRYEIFELS